MLNANVTREAIDRLEPMHPGRGARPAGLGRRASRSLPQIKRYIVDICQATRVDPGLQLPGPPRASLALMRASRVVAASQGREDVIPDDVQAVLQPVLAHRLALTPDAELRDDTIDKVIERVTARVKPPAGRQAPA